MNELLTETQQVLSECLQLSRSSTQSVQEVLTLTSRLEQVQAEALKDSLTAGLAR
ncbi:MAG: hypothetical protein ACJ8R9_18845 [Steroidobacteraceae bacterium]